ncbi:M23 family metallopeptidase [Candidatus Jorgensenbacteria bacterium]|nr:M23 family metallopeptidase [Candidatus Jorgensenbacteria bacterium]
MIGMVNVIKRLAPLINVGSVLFIVVALGAGLFITHDRGDEVFLAAEFEESNDFNIGGPVVAEKSGIITPTIAVDGVFDIAAEDPFVIFNNDGLVQASSPTTGNITITRDGLTRYRVKSRDTLSNIAAQFGVDVQTIRAANPELGSTLKLGEELIILPVSGVLYEVREGDALEIVASRYSADVNLVRRYNPDYQRLFATPGSLVVLPHVQSKNYQRFVRSDAKLPDLRSYYVLPARGWNWGELHEKNAVDVANKCGTPVYAAAEGLIVPDEVLGDGLRGWNNGYGLFIYIEHPNSTKTRYAHLNKIIVRPGDYVTQGQEIGFMGNTGNTHGPTGCHLHFEVYGARNPFSLR